MNPPAGGPLTLFHSSGGNQHREDATQPFHKVGAKLAQKSSSWIKSQQPSMFDAPNVHAINVQFLTVHMSRSRCALGFRPRAHFRQRERLGTFVLSMGWSDLPASRIMLRTLCPQPVGAEIARTPICPEF